MKAAGKALMAIGLLAVATVAIQLIPGSTTPPTPRLSHPIKGTAHLAPGSLLVFRSAQAMDEAFKMIARDVHKTHPELIAPFIVCMVSGGEAVTVLDATVFRREVILDSGVEKGCRGWTAMENVVP